MHIVFRHASEYGHLHRADFNYFRKLHKLSAKSTRATGVFPPAKSGRKIYWKIWIFKYPASREIYVGIPGNFFILARISVVLISIIPT